MHSRLLKFKNEFVFIIVCGLCGVFLFWLLLYDQKTPQSTYYRFEISHSPYVSLDPCLDSTCTPDVIWFYLTPGSGVFVELSNILFFDEFDVLGRTGLESPPRISYSMVRVNEKNNALSKHLNVSKDIQGIVRWNHREETFPNFRHELMVFTDGKFNETSRLEELVHEKWFSCDNLCTSSLLHYAGCNSILPFDTCERTARVRIAFLGDSLTRGDGTHENTSRGPSNVRNRGNFPIQLQEKTNFWDVKNFGHGGSTVQTECYPTAGAYRKTATFQEALGWFAHVYVVMLGTNDVMTCWNNRKAFIIEFNQLIVSILRRVPGAQIYVLVPPPILINKSKDFILRNELANILIEMANRQQTFHVWDLLHLCRNPWSKQNCFQPSSYLDDGIHLNVKGSSLVAMTLYRLLSFPNIIKI